MGEQTDISIVDTSDRPDEAVFVDQATGRRTRRRVYVWTFEVTPDGRVGTPMVLDRAGQRLVPAAVYAAEVGNCTFESVRPWASR